MRSRPSVGISATLPAKAIAAKASTAYGRASAIDPNAADVEGRAALHGAAHKGRNAVVQLLVDRGARLDARDKGSRDTVNGDMKGLTWEPLNYAQGLVRVGVQSAIAHPETAKLIKKLMDERGLEIPPDITSSICLTKGVKGCQ